MGPRLPNLIVIGAMKAGTTSLHYYLNQHPDIFMSKIKEPHFFVHDFNWDKGIDWYKNLFITDKKICGESSQGYTKCHIDKGVPKLMHSVIPDTKLIYIIRDPIDRILSHNIEHLYEVGETNIDLNEILLHDKDEHIIKTSMYFYQIQAYLKYFKKEQLYILTLEDLKENRLQEMNKIFDFLGVKRLNDNNLFNFVKNKSEGRKMDSITLKKIKNSKIKSFAKKILPKKMFNYAKNKITKLNIMKKELKKTALKPEVEAHLIEVFKNDVAALRDFTNKNFDNWRKY